MEFIKYGYTEKFVIIAHKHPCDKDISLYRVDQRKVVSSDSSGITQNIKSVSTPRVTDEKGS